MPPTSQNQAAIEADLREFVQAYLDLDDAGLTHRCEQAIRNYDPCISCSAHLLDLTVERSLPDRQAVTTQVIPLRDLGPCDAHPFPRCAATTEKDPGQTRRNGYRPRRDGTAHHAIGIREKRRRDPSRSYEPNGMGETE